MLEICFAIILGFGLASVSGAVLSDSTRIDRILVRSTIILVLLATIVAIWSGESIGIIKLTQGLIISSLEFRLGWVLLGASVAILIELYQEGHVQDIWIRFNPETVPTLEARAGQRAKGTGFRHKVVQATLVGTSTTYLTEELDLKTDTLVRLALYAFENRGSRTVMFLESALKLGTGRRQREFLKLANSANRRANPKKVVHRYWRSVNGSSRMGQALFGELCQLAHVTGNLDPASVGRLQQVGLALNLTPEEMSRSLSFMR